MISPPLVSEMNKPGGGLFPECRQYVPGEQFHLFKEFLDGVHRPEQSGDMGYSRSLIALYFLNNVVSIAEEIESAYIGRGE